ncbi:hypothetical protein DFJ43DRAFT_1156209 [Lentinula guzmanii]|uniref:RING-type domain-containing protein n=1 Tax=Lentinula guzmanii TaxID=2804957 RepID=A0AA38JDK1_9AGAR|nr:hypothetical protein DFJ43DRAFT_1156209 [Lentinula guzmanii]
MAPTPSTASSRSLSASQRKRTSKSNRALLTTLTGHPQTRSLPNPQTSSGSKRSSSRNAPKDVIDLSNNDSDADSDICSLITSPSHRTRSTSQRIASSSRNVSTIERSDSDTDIVATKQALTLEVDIRKRLADVLIELDASKKKIEKYEATNTCRKCSEIMWQPCILPCGHAMCAECIYECSCKVRISRPPVLSWDWQKRVEGMARQSGIPIPERPKFVWPSPPGWTPRRNLLGLVP